MAASTSAGTHSWFRNCPARSASATRSPRCTWTSPILQTFYETGDIAVTGWATFHCIVDAVGASALPRYMVWNGGNGNWNTTEANWNHGAATWDNSRPDNAIYNSSGDPTVTLTEPISAGSLWFATGSAYTIAASGTGALALTSPAAITNDADATISAPITSGALNKWGASELTLSGANTYAGATTVGAGTLEFNAPAAMGTTSAIRSKTGLRSPSPRGLPDRRSALRLPSTASCTPSCLVAGITEFTGPITLQNSSQIYGQAAASSTVNLNSVISGGGNVTFLGAGDGSDQVTFVVAAANTYMPAIGYSYGTADTNGLSIRAWSNVSDQLLDGPRFSVTSPTPAPTDSRTAGTIGYATQSINMSLDNQEAFTDSNGCGVADPGTVPDGLHGSLHGGIPRQSLHCHRGHLLVRDRERQLQLDMD